MPLRSANPATGAFLADYPEASPVEVESRLERAREVFLSWRRTPFRERAGRLRRTADLLRERTDEHALLVTREMGKPVTQARAELERCAAACEYYAENAERFLSPDPRDSGVTASYVRYDPLGAVLAIMPWNFPFWQVLRFAAPCLASGNVALLKHAPSVTGCALALEELLADAGFPSGAFQALLIGEERVAAVIRDARVCGVSLTGSERAGSAVGETAGRALKRVVLELGGSDPFLVLADCDLEKALAGAVTARTMNSGQSCIAAKRFLVDERVAEEFARELARRFESLRMGDPEDPDTDVGPLARADLRENLHRQVERSVAQGARVLCGGRVPEGPGCFYPPTVLDGVLPGMAVADEETFGPVAALLSFRDEEEALALANATPYGLGASVWTRDTARGELIAERLEAGSVFVNDIVKSDPRLPFGGIKRSGHGRELSVEGIREFVNAKTVRVA